MPPLYLLQNAASASSLWAPAGAVGVVTGANKGIGLEIAAGLAANGLPVIAASRSEERGRAAVEAVRSRPENKAEVSFLQLDVASDASVCEFAKNLQRAAPAGVAILVSNAAIAFKGDTWGGDEAEETININYRGTKRVTEAVLPLLVDGGRVVNVCSRSGQLDRLFGASGGGGGSGSGSPRSPRPPPASDGSEVLRKKWSHAAETGDFSSIDNLASEFVAAVREGTAGMAGWPRSMYGVSKLAQICYTRALALSFAKEKNEKYGGKSLSAFALCPGSVKTDMSSQRGTKTPEEGADTAVWLSLVPSADGRLQARSRLFFGEREVIDF